MKLIRYIGKKLTKNGKKQSWGLFLCPFCLKEVEKQIGHGKRDKSCGCKTGELISEANKGRKDPKEVRIKKSNSMKGIKKSEEHKQKLSKANKGIKKTEEQKQKIAETLRRFLSDPSKSSNWQGGKSFEEYGIEFNKKFKQEILNRDNNKCQNPNCEYLSDILDCHHINFDKKNNNTENLITLCRNCHAKTFGKKKKQYWADFYQNIMMGKLMECFL